MRARSAALGLALTALTSCLTGSADFSNEKRAIELATGLTLTPDTSVAIGGAALGLARWLGGSSGEEDEVLRHLERVEVAVFKVRGDSRRAVDALPSPPGWTCVVRARERRSSVKVLLEEASSRSARLMVAASEENELVLVRAQGALEAIAEQALARGSSLSSRGHRSAVVELHPADPAEDD